MHSIRIRATARIIDVGAGFIGEVDAEDGMHIDFRPQLTKAECLRQIQWTSDRLGLATVLDQEEQHLAAMRTGMRDGYAPRDMSMVRAEAQVEVLRERDSERAGRRSENDRRKAANHASLNRWLHRLAKSGGES